MLTEIFIQPLFKQVSPNDSRGLIYNMNLLVTAHSRVRFWELDLLIFCHWGAHTQCLCRAHPTLSKPKLGQASTSLNSKCDKQINQSKQYWIIFRTYIETKNNGKQTEIYIYSKMYCVYKTKSITYIKYWKLNKKRNKQDIDKNTSTTTENE